MWSVFVCELVGGVVVKGGVAERESSCVVLEALRV